METGRRDRLYLMDEIRGILILYVVLYHLLYDVSQIFYVGSIPWMYSPWMDGLRNVMVGMLIIIAGISCTLSRNNARRGLRILFVALCLTVVTAIAVPEELILFGILHFFWYRNSDLQSVESALTADSLRCGHGSIGLSFLGYFFHL